MFLIFCLYRGSSIFHFQFISFYDIYIVKINVIGSTVPFNKSVSDTKDTANTDYIYVFLKIKFQLTSIDFRQFTFSSGDFVDTMFLTVSYISTVHRKVTLRFEENSVFICCCRHFIVAIYCV